MNTIKRPASRISSPKATLPAPSIGAALDGGLGYYDLFDHNAYTYVQVGPIPKANTGDTVTVIWAGSNVAFYDIKDTDLGKTFPIPVINSKIADAGDGDKVLGYFITYHQGSGQEFSDPPVHIRVKRTIPGGLDPKPETPHNEGIALAEIRPNPVPPEATEVAIVVPLWKNPALGDQMVVSWNGAMFFAPLLSDARFPETVSVTLSAQDVLDAGIGEGVPVTWGIHDTVANWSGWAETVEVNVRIEDPGNLLAPHVGSKDEPWTQIDLVTLAGKDLEVFTPDYDGAANGDIVIVHARGTALDGSTIVFDSDPQPMPDPGYGLTFKIPNGTVADLAGGEMRIWYTVTGKSDSYSVWLDVIGAAQGDFPVPVVTEAVDSDGDGMTDWLDPAKADPFAHVTIDYPSMARDDVVTLILEGTAADGTPVKLSYPQPQISTPAPISATVPYADILRFLHSRVDVYYQVSPYSRRPVFIRALGELESEHLALRIRLAGDTNPYPAPVVTDDHGNVIVENGSVGPAVAYADAQASYVYPAIDDEIIYSWVGSVSTQTNPYRVGNPAALPADRADRVFLDKNKGGEMTVSFSVKRGGLAPAEPSKTLTFRLQAYTEDFEGVPVGPTYPGNTLDIGTMKISATRNFAIGDGDLPPNHSRMMSMPGETTLTFYFPNDLREVRWDALSYGIGNNPPPQVVIEAWNSAGSSVLREVIVVNTAWQTITLTSENKDIHRITYTTTYENAFFDNFVLVE